MRSCQMTMILLAISCVGGCTAWSPAKRISSTPQTDQASAAMALLDSDHDGYLSRDELEHQHAIGLLRDLRVADTDRDGRISVQEWNAWWPAMTHAQPAASLPLLNESSAPTNDIRSH